MNLPIISSKVGDLNKIIINGQNGYIIEKYDHILFSKKIHQLLTDKKKLIQIGKANRSKAEKLYDVNIIANKTFQFYSLISNSYKS